MAALRAASWPCHQALERRIDVGSRFTDRGRYQSHLARLWGFCSVLEPGLDAAALQAALPDLEARRKTPLLARDLAALGVTPQELAALPRCTHLPASPDVSAALGVIYVFEGATLGGQTLLPLVHRRLGLVQGIAFLSSYGDQVAPMWERFGAALESWCVQPERRQRAIENNYDPYGHER